MRTMLIIILSFGFLIFGVDNRSFASGEAIRVTHKIMEKVAFDHIYDPNLPHYNSIWSIWFTVNDRSQPAQIVNFTIRYDAINGEIKDCQRGTGQDYESNFTTIQPFFDFIDFIEQNSDFFFDHSEFEGIDPFWHASQCVGNAGWDEYFYINAPGGSIICKGITSDEINPPESEQAIELLRILFTDVILCQNEHYIF